MKKSGLFGILLGIVLLALTGSSRAQIEITWDEYMLDVGTVIEQESAGDTVTVDVGNPGGPQVWDFTSQACAVVTETRVVERTTTPFADQFPSANFVLETDSADSLHWHYHQVTPSFSEFQGWGWQIPDTSVYKRFSPPGRTPLPLVYGSSYHYEWGWSDTMEADPDTIIYSFQTYGRHTVDAYGTVQIPLGNFKTLRVASFDTITITWIMEDISFDATTTHINYSWLSEDVGQVVCIGSDIDETDPNFTTAHCFSRLKSLTGIADGEPMSLRPGDFQLGQNYPNPFNPTTTIEYLIPKTGLVQLKIYNTAGQLVKTLVEEAKAPGKYSAIWDGSNEAGSPVATGVYLYRLRAGDDQITRKMVILK